MYKIIIESNWKQKSFNDYKWALEFIEKEWTSNFDITLESWGKSIFLWSWIEWYWAFRKLF